MLSSNSRVTLAAVATGVLYNVSTWLVPQLEQGAIDRYRLSAVAAGLVPSTENLLAGLISIALARWARWSNLRGPTLFALLLWFAAYLGTGLAATPAELVLLRVASGIGSGIFVYVSSTLAAASLRPDRTYSALTVTANSFVGLVLMSMSWVFPGAAPLAIFPYAALLALIWSPLTLLQSSRLGSAQPSVASRQSVETAGCSTLQAAALVVAFTLESVMNVSTFTFSIPLGLRTGMAEASLGSTLGFAVFIGTLGALCVWFLPRRAGHALPLAVALLAAVVSNCIAATTSSPTQFQVSLAANQVLAFFMYPLFLGWSVELDPSGRTAALMTGVVTITCALCPAVAGALVDSYGLFALLPEILLTGVFVLAGIAVAAFGTAPATSRGR